MTFLKKIFQSVVETVTPVPPAPHVCRFEYRSYCFHYCQVSEISNVITNPSWYHYPTKSIALDWIEKGYNWASVCQSHWSCSCGKNLTYFFLANPCVDYRGKKHINTIPTDFWEEMKKHHPVELNSSRGISLQEMTDELVEKFC